MREWEIGRGERIWQVSGSALSDSNLTLVVAQDVTARKAVETEYVHAAKMAAIGRMASGVAHEIGNPIASLSARLDLIERRNNPQFTRESVGVIRDQIRRIGRIVRGLSQFARAPRPEWSPCDLGAVLNEAVEMARLDPAARNVRIETPPGGPLPATWCVKDHVTQVCLNLLLNAAEAMPEGGTVRASARAERDRIEVEIRDTGPGIPAAVLARIGSPFFTTKPGGSGLGLSISRQLVEAHGGELRYGNGDGGGASFVFTLPVRTRPEEAGIVEWEG